MSDKAAGLIHFSRQENPERWGADWPVDYARAKDAESARRIALMMNMALERAEAAEQKLEEAKRIQGDQFLRAEAAEQKLDEVLKEQERYFQQLEIRGVPRERAKRPSNGIDVLATRYDRAYEAAEQKLGRRDALLREALSLFEDGMWASYDRREDVRDTRERIQKELAC